MRDVAVNQLGAIRLDQALFAANLARSRAHAQQLIVQKQVTVDGKIIVKPSHRVTAAQQLKVQKADNYVSRGAYKLLAALEAFELCAQNKLALDLGASTGGFTQVLLEAGARHVYALDVGHSQLAAQLAQDSRVTKIEGVNARYLDSAQLQQITGSSQKPELVVGDLSFISLSYIFPAVAATAAADAQLCFLIKPQFEVGRQALKNGIVADRALRAAAVKKVIDSAAGAGYATLGLIPSPILGNSGNCEYLGYWVRSTQPNQAQWYERLATLTAH